MSRVGKAQCVRHGDTIYWQPPPKRGPGAACAEPTWEARDDAGGIMLRQGAARLWAPIDFLRAVVADHDARDAAAALAQQPPQPLDRVHDQPDERGRVEQRDHAQRGED